jgi:hypothetical protein
MADETPEDWTDEQRNLFSRLWRHMETNQHLFTHPQAPRVTAEHWRITCWNAAWLATEFSDPEFGTAIHVDENGNVEGREIPKGAMQ